MHLIFLLPADPEVEGLFPVKQSQKIYSVVKSVHPYSIMIKISLFVKRKSPLYLSANQPYTPGLKLLLQYIIVKGIVINCINLYYLNSDLGETNIQVWTNWSHPSQDKNAYSSYTWAILSNPPKPNKHRLTRSVWCWVWVYQCIKQGVSWSVG